jgi:hypothetical protein
MDIPEQTDLFVVDETGQVNVFWAVESAPWGGPAKIGPAGFAPAGAPLATCQEVGRNQTDLLVVDRTGQLNVLSVYEGAPWSGPTKIGAPGLAPPGAPVAASAQFGLTQTDVFVVDKSGQLNVFWTFEGGPWSGPAKIGPADFAPAGAPLAASRHAGLDQTDVFVLDTTGQLNVFAVSTGGPWSGPTKIGPAGFAAPGAQLAACEQRFGLKLPFQSEWQQVGLQTDVFVVDRTGQLNVFSIHQGGSWAGPVKLGPAGFAAAGAPIATCEQVVPPQTAAFVVDKTGQLNVFSVFESDPWSGPAKIGQAGFAPSGARLAASQQFSLPQTDVFVADPSGQLNVFSATGSGPWSGPTKIGAAAFAAAGAAVGVSEQFGVLEPPVAAPGGGLGSLSNYFLTSNCKPLTGVSVTIRVTEDLVSAPPAAGHQPGFSFQLNASSPVNKANPSDPKWTVWQQYLIGVGPTFLGAVNNWTLAALKSGNQSINSSPDVHLGAPAKPYMIAAGSTLTISLDYDAAGNVSGVTFGVTPGGPPQTLALTTIELSGGGLVTTADLAPIVAFELNLVGPGDLQHAHFTSGAGTITYAASNLLTPLSALPSCVASGVTTGESSNSTYGTLPLGPLNTFTQTFAVNPTAT